MYPRSYAIAALIVSLVIGLIGGIVVVRESPALFAAPAAGKSGVPGTVEGPTPSPSRSLDPFAFPPTPPKVIAALHALGTTRTSLDNFPAPTFLTATAVDASTVHRILTTDDGSTLWIGRTADRLCLLFSSVNPSPTQGIYAGSSCATPADFAQDGLTLQEGNDRWTWNGERFTTTIEQY
ncbi:MAG TPA: hypothetical protein VHZ81_00045 [Galbitalea sp.]|nr:hypothetical protein [Galbitalea sp.]